MFRGLDDNKLRKILDARLDTLAIHLWLPSSRSRSRTSSNRWSLCRPYKYRDESTQLFNVFTNPVSWQLLNDRLSFFVEHVSTMCKLVPGQAGALATCFSDWTQMSSIYTDSSLYFRRLDDDTFQLSGCEREFRLASLGDPCSHMVPRGAFHSWITRSGSICYFDVVALL